MATTKPDKTMLDMASIAGSTEVSAAIVAGVQANSITLGTVQASALPMPL